MHHAGGFLSKRSEPKQKLVKIKNIWATGWNVQNFMDCSMYTCMRWSMGHHEIIHSLLRCSKVKLPGYSTQTHIVYFGIVA